MNFCGDEWGKVEGKDKIHMYKGKKNIAMSDYNYNCQPFHCFTSQKFKLCTIFFYMLYFQQYGYIQRVTATQKR